MEQVAQLMCPGDAFTFVCCAMPVAVYPAPRVALDDGRNALFCVEGVMCSVTLQTQAGKLNIRFFD